MPVIEAKVIAPIKVTAPAAVAVETSVSGSKPTPVVESRPASNTQTVGITGSERPSLQPEPAPTANKTEATPVNPKPAETQPAPPQTPETPPPPKSETPPPPKAESGFKYSTYYEALGVSQKATPAEIRQAFRDLAQKYHPDRNPNGEEAFKEINEAYQVLSNESKRIQYDGGLQKTVSAAESADKIVSEFYPEQRKSFVQSGYESVSGKPYSGLTPDQLVVYTPAAIPAIAENYYLALVQNENPGALALITGPEAAVVQSLLLAGNESDAQRIVLQYLIMAILSALETVGKAASGNLEGSKQAFSEATDRAQIAGEITKRLKSGKSPQQIVSDILGRSQKPEANPPQSKPTENAQPKSNTAEVFVPSKSPPTPEKPREVPLLPANAESAQNSPPALPSEVDDLIAKERAKIAQTTVILAATRNLSQPQQVELSNAAQANVLVQTPTPS